MYVLEKYYIKDDIDHQYHDEYKNLFRLLCGLLCIVYCYKVKIKFKRH